MVPYEEDDKDAGGENFISAFASTKSGFMSTLLGHKSPGTFKIRSTYKKTTMNFVAKETEGSQAGFCGVETTGIDCQSWIDVRNESS